MPMRRGKCGIGVLPCLRPFCAPQNFTKGENGDD